MKEADIETISGITSPDEMEEVEPDSLFEDGDDQVDDDDDSTQDTGEHPNDDVEMSDEDDDSDVEESDPESPTPQSNIEQLSAQVQQQQAQMNQLLQAISGSVPQQPEQLARETSGRVDTETRPGFVSEDEFNSMFDSHDHFNKILGKKMETQRADVLRQATETVMTVFSQQKQNEDLRKEFYKEYPELRQHSDQLVAPVANVIQQQNPNMGLQEIFKATGDYLYKTLGHQGKGKAGKPNLAPTNKRGRRGRRGKPKSSDAHQQILDQLIAGELQN